MSLDDSSEHTFVRCYWLEISWTTAVFVLMITNALMVNLWLSIGLGIIFWVFASHIYISYAIFDLDVTKDVNSLGELKESTGELVDELEAIQEEDDPR